MSGAEKNQGEVQGWASLYRGTQVVTERVMYQCETWASSEEQARKDFEEGHFYRVAQVQREALAAEPVLHINEEREEMGI